MELTVVFNNPANPNRWRPFERESLQRIFPTIRESDPETTRTMQQPDCVLWKLSAEKTRTDQLVAAIDSEKRWWDVPQINRPTGWLSAHAKDQAFATWDARGIPTPKWGRIKNFDDLFNIHQFLPALVRINYANTGDGSLLCYGPNDLLKAWSLIPSWYIDAERRYGPGVARAIIWTSFVDHQYMGLRYSYRVIVCCGKIITAYARTCPADGWLAITSKFRSEDGEKWLELNRRCRSFCQQNEDTIVRAVRCLGLEWQGVDIIFDDDGRPYFLEVQPDYSCGNPRYGATLPWFNPSYPDLVKFLQDNWERVQVDLPEYAFDWLDKERHFTACTGCVARFAGIKP